MVLQQLRQSIKEIHDQFYDILEKSDFSIPTFLSFGAALQLLFFTFLPPRVASLPGLLWLGYRFLSSVWRSRNIFKTSFKDVRLGGYEARVPDEYDGVVVFMIAARLTHPFGKLAPGMVDIDIVFKNMWREAEKNREKWGFLGKTATLVDTSDKEGTTNAWLTYWRDVKGLHAFAASPAHRLGWTRYLAGKYPYVGVMHELYHAPKGHYETVYGNISRFGLSAMQIPREGEDGQTILSETVVDETKGSNMFSRMARNGMKKSPE